MEAIQVNLDDAKTDLSPFVEQVLDGADVVGQGVVDALAGRALVRLVPVQGDAVLSCDLKANFKNDIESMFG